MFFKSLFAGVGNFLHELLDLLDTPVEELEDMHVSLGQFVPEIHTDINGKELPLGVTRGMLIDGIWNGHGHDCPCHDCFIKYRFEGNWLVGVKDHRSL